MWVGVRQRGTDDFSIHTCMYNVPTRVRRTEIKRQLCCTVFRDLSRKIVTRTDARNTEQGLSGEGTCGYDRFSTLKKNACTKYKNFKKTKGVR